MNIHDKRNHINTAECESSYLTGIVPPDVPPESVSGYRHALGLEIRKFVERLALKPAPPFETCFEEAQRIIYGDREQTYGHPSKNLNHIAEQWTLYLRQRYGEAPTIVAEDVCWMMADLKKSRQLNASKRDNIVDAIGYIGLIERIAE